MTIEEIRNNFLKEVQDLTYDLSRFEMTTMISFLLHSRFEWRDGDSSKEMLWFLTGSNDGATFRNHTHKMNEVFSKGRDTDSIIKTGNYKLVCDLNETAAAFRQFLLSYTSYLRGKRPTSLGTDSVRLLKMSDFAIDWCSRLKTACDLGVNIPIVPNPSHEAELKFPSQEFKMMSALRDHFRSDIRDSNRLYGLFDGVNAIIGYNVEEDRLVVADGTLSWALINNKPKYECYPRYDHGLYNKCLLEYSNYYTTSKIKQTLNPE